MPSCDARRLPALLGRELQGSAQHHGNSCEPHLSAWPRTKQLQSSKHGLGQPIPTADMPVVCGFDALDQPAISAVPDADCSIAACCGQQRAASSAQPGPNTPGSAGNADYGVHHATGSFDAPQQARAAATSHHTQVTAGEATIVVACRQQPAARKHGHCCYCALQGGSRSESTSSHQV